MPVNIVLPAVEADDRTAYAGLLLARGSMLRIDDGQDTLVAARNGRVWLTQERERCDVVLEAGQQFRITRGGATLIEALRDSEIELLSAGRKHLAKGIDPAAPGAASALPRYESRPGLRGRMAALGASLKRAWLDLYAPPPRRACQIV